jgi:NADPH-dependent curcumin reductase CurA
MAPGRLRGREVRLARRPRGATAVSDFAVIEVDLREPGAGEVLVRNRVMSVDPYMRLPMTGQEGVHAAMSEGETLHGAAVGVVEASRSPDLPEGAWVSSASQGWREAYVAPARTLTRIDPLAGDPGLYVGLLGLIGVTAYAGVEYVLQPRAGETVFVSGGAGAVGMVACQLAKRRGARVIATTGSDEKAAWLRGEIGVDVAINYRTAGNLAEALRAAAPGGLDGMFDNVGGSTLEAAIEVMKMNGRIALCGAIELYNSSNYRAGPANFFTVIEKCLVLKGFNAGPYYSRAGEIFGALTRMLAAGELIWRETVREGIEAAPQAFVDLMAGGNFGKMLVRL